MTPQREVPQQDPPGKTLQRALDPSGVTIPQTSLSHIHCLAIFGLIVAILIPPLGLVLSILAWRKTVKTHNKGSAFAITGAIVGASLTLMIIAGVVVLMVLSSLFAGANQPNQAETDLQPIIRSLTQSGGHIVCDGGDNGNSLDNTIPWYTAYYEVSDDRVLQDLEAAAKQQNFMLAVDTSRIRQLKDGSIQGEHFNPNASYLTATTHGKELDITIDRNGLLPLECNFSDPANYGKIKTVSEFMDLVHLTMTLPATN